MPSSYEDYAYDQYMSDLGHEEELQRAIEDISTENASWYLGTFGDALEGRVRGLIEEAKVLAQLGHAGATLVLCVTALEFVLRLFFADFSNKLQRSFSSAGPHPEFGISRR